MSKRAGGQGGRYGPLSQRWRVQLETLWDGREVVVRRAGERVGRRERGEGRVAGVGVGQERAHSSAIREADWQGADRLPGHLTRLPVSMFGRTHSQPPSRPRSIRVNYIGWAEGTANAPGRGSDRDKVGLTTASGHGHGLTAVSRSPSSVTATKEAGACTQPALRWQCRPSQRGPSSGSGGVARTAASHVTLHSPSSSPFRGRSPTRR